MLRTAAVALLTLFMGGPVFGRDDLAAVAAREKERRAQAKKRGTAKTYTDEDLKDKAGPKDKNTTAVPSASESSPRSQEGGSGDDGQKGWSDRAAGIRAAAKDAQTRVSALEARIADLQLDRNPNSADLLDPNRLQKREAEKAAAIQDLEKAKADLAATQKDRENLEEEARREHVPAAWIQ
jgi:hypothetical protein